MSFKVGLLPSRDPDNPVSIWFLLKVYDHWQEVCDHSRKIYDHFLKVYDISFEIIVSSRILIFQTKKRHKYGNFHIFSPKSMSIKAVRTAFLSWSMDHTTSKSPGPIRPSLWGYLYDMWFQACNSLMLDWFTAYKSSHSRLLLYKRALHRQTGLGWSF